MADTRWLNFLYNELQENFKVQDKIELKFQLSLSVKPCAFPIQGKCHFQTLSKILGSGAVLTVSWAAWGGSCPSPWALGGWIQSWASWPLLSPGQPPDVPRLHGSTSVPWLVLTSPQKTLCSWRRVSCTWKQFWQIWADFGSKRQNAPGPTLATKNVTGCTGPGTSCEQEIPFELSHKQLNLFHITVYCPCHKQCTLQFIKPFEHSMLEHKSYSVLRGQKPPLNYNDK